MQSLALNALLTLSGLTVKIKQGKFNFDEVKYKMKKANDWWGRFCKAFHRNVLSLVEIFAMADRFIHEKRDNGIAEQERYGTMDDKQRKH